MIVYRLCKEKYANDLSGIGAERFGGRWNHIGIPILYTSQSIALCALEIAVHLPLGLVPKNYFLINIEIPDSIKISVLKELPKNWNAIIPIDATQKMGDKFIVENKSLVLKVPSASVQGDFNYLINPNHKDFEKVKIKKTEPFSFDERLFVKK